METRKEIAAEKKRCNSHNCAQAVVQTYADIAGIVLGLVNKDKAKSMKQMRVIMNKFQERNCATQCKMLKGIGTKVVLRACPDCVADACEFLEEQLTNNN